MSEPNAAASGTFTLGGELEVRRLGFGAMRVTGPGIWGDPEDPAEARRVLARLPELGVNFIDTADAYGPFVSEDLLREVLYPYPGTLIATKGGLTRHGPNVWKAVGRPEYLRQCVLMSLRRLDVEQIDLWQLHRIDAAVPRDEQFDLLRQLKDEGLVRHVGLSQVSVEEIEAASQWVEIATVQNLYNLVRRDSEDVLAHCEANGIGFIPWFPLAAGDLAQPGTVLDDVAAERDATHAQVALAWLLRKSPVMLPIPGTGKVAHLEQNVAAAQLDLSDDEVARLDAAGREAWEASRDQG
jgi:aryl-alcohol dehydrogenase-like predicted oxidoreductase